MRKPWLLLLATLMLTGLTACNGDDDDNGDDELARVRALHASADAPALNMQLGGTPLAAGLDFATGTGFTTLQAGQAQLTVEGLNPTGTVTFVGPTPLDLEDGNDYTVTAVGPSGSIQTIVISRPQTDLASGEVRLQVLHAAPSVGTVDAYVTTPGADLAAAAPAATLSYQQASDPVDVPAGSYQIRLTPAGAPAVVVFDSGPVPLTAGDDLLLAAVPFLGPGLAPVQLIQLDGSGSTPILDAGTQSSLRAVHAVADAPPVDVIANDVFALPLIEDLAFPEATSFLTVPAGPANLKITPAGNGGSILVDQDVDLDPGSMYTVVALGPLASISAAALPADHRPVATAAKLRVIHGSPTAGTVDLYLTTPGTDLATATPVAANVPFSADTGFLQVAPGSYELTVTPTGSTTPAIGPLAVTLDASGVYTAVARDAVGGGAPLDLILLDDFAP